MQEKIIIVDIDGILTDYPKCFLKWYSHTYYTTLYESIDEMQENMMIEDYNYYKHEYRMSHAKRSLPVNENIVNALKILSDDYFIWIVTTRPEISPVKEDTIFWLESNDVPFHEISFVTNKSKFIQRLLRTKHTIIMIMDDNLKEMLK